MQNLIFSRVRRNRFIVPATTCMIVLVLSGSAFAQPGSWLRGGHRKSTANSRDNSAMMRLVRPLSETVQNSVVQVFSGPRVVALGTVVSADGYLITKRSELIGGDTISVRLPTGSKVSARVAAYRPRHDLALLKLEEGTEATWNIQAAKLGSALASTGSFVVSPGRSGYPIGFGVLGVSARRVGHDGRLGVRFPRQPGAPARVEYVLPRSGADEAGIQLSDQILKVNNIDMLSWQAAMKALKSKYPGEVVRLTIMRGQETLEVDAMMSDQSMLRESKNDAKVNGPRSIRLNGFDQVIQHDTVLAPNQCGGPLLDSRGQVIGINIARAGRVVSYALPASLVAAEIVNMLGEARR